MEDIYQFNIDLIQESVLWVNQAGIIENTNKAACRSLEYQQLELVGMPIHRVDDKLTNTIWQKHWKIIQKEGHAILEAEYLTKSGKQIPMSIDAHFVQQGPKQFILIFSRNPTVTNQYQRLFEITEKVSKIGAWDWDLVTNEVVNTKAIYNIYDLPKNEYFDIQTAFSCFSENSLKRLEAAIEKLKKQKESFDFTLDLISFKGIKKIIYVAANPKIFNGKVIKIQGVLQDISHRIQKERQTFLKDVTIEHTGDLVFWSHLNGQLFFVNNAAVQNLGYSKEEMLEKQVWDIVEDYPKEKWLSNAAQLKSTKRKRITTRHRRKNGTTYPTSTELNYVTYRDVDYICAIVRNEEQTEKYQERLQLNLEALNQVTDIILWTSLKGQLIYFNQAISHQLGYSEEEFSVITPAQLIVGYHRPHQQNYRQLLKEQKYYTGECQLVRKDGTLLEVEVKSTLSEYEGKTINCSVFRDISNRKKEEKKLRNLLDENQELRLALEAENNYFQEEIHQNHNFDNIITSSTEYRKILNKISEVAETDATVLITGETGTGKELVARAVHQLSNRAERPLVKINCAALPANLIESELFGHEKGAFTGAFVRKIGRFELANLGTLLLDEIGELPLDLQPKLLRILQEGEFSRLGSNKVIKTDVRIIAATNRDLLGMIKEGTFREDLYYRLNVYPIHNISLRERKEDIPVLVKHFIKKINKKIGRQVSKMSTRSMNKLQQYDYPGNIRELENIIERAVITSKTSTLNLDQWLPATNPNHNKAGKSHFLTFQEMERKHILDALASTDWKIGGKDSASELLGLNRKTLGSKMRKLGISKKTFLVPKEYP